MMGRAPEPPSMRNATGCFTPDELSEYAAGRLGHESAEEIANHLRVCDACWDLVRSAQRDGSTHATRPGLSRPSETPAGPHKHPETPTDEDMPDLFGFLAPA